jgi:hypothetical protein
LTEARESVSSKYEQAIPGVQPDSAIFDAAVFADWLAEDHLARFIVEVTDTLDLTCDLRGIRVQGRAGAGGIGYATGLTSSRRIEQSTYDEVAVRYLPAWQHPDRDTIAQFRQRYLEALDCSCRRCDYANPEFTQYQLPRRSPPN